MASEAEIKLGRLAVERGLLTQEQVLTVLRERNDDPDGPDLGPRLVVMGLLTEESCQDLLGSLDEVDTSIPRRDQMATDHAIPLGGAREAIARECLREAEQWMESDRDAAVKELRRLSEEFADTESGNRAHTLLKQLEGSS